MPSCFSIVYLQPNGETVKKTDTHMLSVFFYYSLEV